MFLLLQGLQFSCEVLVVLFVYSISATNVRDLQSKFPVRHLDFLGTWFPGSPGLSHPDTHTHTCHTWALSTAFSFSSIVALWHIWSSRIFLWSLDFLAAKLFLFLRSKYLLSFKSSGIGFFSPLGRRGTAFARARVRRVLLGLGDPMGDIGIIWGEIGLSSKGDVGVGIRSPSRALAARALLKDTWSETGK